MPAYHRHTPHRSSANQRNTGKAPERRKAGYSKESRVLFIDFSAPVRSRVSVVMDSSESRPSRRRLQGRLFTISPARARAGLTKAGFRFHFQYPAAKLHTLKNATHVNHADKQATGSSAEVGSPVPPTPALVVTSHQPLFSFFSHLAHVPRATTSAHSFFFSL